MFLKFSNKDNKEWIMPIHNMRTGLNIYQPSGVKGKLIKILLPYIYCLPIIKKAMTSRRVTIRLDKEVSNTIKRILKVDNFEYSIFEGTPSAHKKRVIQIFKGSKIIAYCKISSNREVIKLLENGKKILSYLHSVGIDNVPTCYYCDKISMHRDEVIFIQSTIKTTKSKIVHIFTRKHWKFLENMYLNTRKELFFVETDLSISICALEKQLSLFSCSDAELLKGKIEKVREFYGDKRSEFSAYHGDFTPWNIFFEKDQLFAFDFEYAAMSYPPFLDWFHYFTQTAILERHQCTSKIVELYRHNSRIEKYCSNTDITYTAYLLDIISRYVSRDGDISSDENREIINTWLGILRNL